MFRAGLPTWVHSPFSHTSKYSPSFAWLCVSGETGFIPSPGRSVLICLSQPGWPTLHFQQLVSEWVPVTILTNWTWRKVGWGAHRQILNRQLPLFSAALLSGWNAWWGCIPCCHLCWGGGSPRQRLHVEGGTMKWGSNLIYDDIVGLIYLLAQELSTSGLLIW